MQEVERRILTQADHIRNVRHIGYLLSLKFIMFNVISLLNFQQNNIFRTREEKYQSRIRVLETLAHSTKEENQVTYEPEFIL